MYKIAVLSFSNPFVDKQDGGKIDIKSRIKCIKKLNIEIDHYSLLKENEKSIKNITLVNKNYTDKINNKISYLFSLYPLSVKNRYSKKLHLKLLEGNYNSYLIENFNMISYIDKKPNEIKTFLRVHNIESLSRFELFKSNPLSIRGILELFESLKYKILEKKSLKCVDKFLFISKNEKRYFEEKYPKYKEKYEWIPPLAECNKLSFKDNKLENYILYYGDLTVSHNIIGIKRFLENVFKNLYKERNIKLKIAGKINKQDKEFLNKYDGVEILGYVDDLDKCIADSKFIISPIYTGAGVKIKVIDAISKGKIVITTPKGIEGTGLQKDITALSADSYEEYLNYCKEALDDNEKIKLVSERGYEYVKKYFSESYLIQKFKEIFNE